MSFLLDPIDSAIDSLLDPVTATAAATSDNVVEPVETSAPTTTSTSKESKSSKSSTATKTKTTSSDHPKSTAAATSSAAASSTITSTDSSTSETSTSSTSTTISTSTTSSSSSISSSTSSTPPAAPSASAQPTLAPAQSHPTNTPSGGSGSGVSTAGIAVGSVIAFVLLASIIFLIIRFCPPVRRRIDAWYEKRREERTWRAALDGVATEKGMSERSLSSAGGASGSSFEKTRPFSFFAVPGAGDGKRDGTRGYENGRERAGSGNGNMYAGGDSMDGQHHHQQYQQYQQPPSYVSPVGHDAPIELYTPITAAHNETSRGFGPDPSLGNRNMNSQGPSQTQQTGLGLGRVSLLRNTSLLRKAGFDAPSPVPTLPVALSGQGPRPLQLPQRVSPTSATQRQSQSQTQRQPGPRASQAQVGRVLRPTTSQIRRKPLPVDPPGVAGSGVQQQRSRAQSTSSSRSIGAFSIDRNLMPLPVQAHPMQQLQAGHSHGHSRSDSLPKLQVHIPGSVPGPISGPWPRSGQAQDRFYAQPQGSGLLHASGEDDGVKRISQSQIGVAVTGSPMVATFGPGTGRVSR